MHLPMPITVPFLHPQHANAVQYCEMVQWSLSL